MSGMQSDTDLMHKANGDINDVRSNVDSAVKQLQGNMEPVLASWRGGASETFRKLMDQFQQNANTISEQLGIIAENIGDTGKDQSQNEEEQAGEMSKIEGMLGS